MCICMLMYCAIMCDCVMCVHSHNDIMLYTWTPFLCRAVQELTFQIARRQRGYFLTPLSLNCHINPSSSDRLVTVTGNRENICKAFAAIGQQMEMVRVFT